MRLQSVFVLCIIGLVSTASIAQEAKGLRAGAATSNITPWLGDPVVGGWNPTGATHIHDELHARCIVLEDGKTKLVIVVCDNVGISREVFDAAKKRIHEATAIPVDNMLMSATHTHSAVSARGDNALVDDGDLSNYQAFLSRRIADGVQRAINNLEPARIGWGAGSEPSQVFNRRWFLKPGVPVPNPFGGEDKVRMNPGAGSPDLLKPADTTDPQISFVSIQARSGRPIALLANYSLHYVGGTGGAEISADYFAMFADRIQQLLGADRLDPPFVGIMSNGTSGDVNNINFFERRQRREPYEQMRIVANQVAAEVFRVHQEIEWHDDVKLGAAATELVLETRRPTPEMIERARMILNRPDDVKPEHVREVSYAHRTLQMAESPSHVSIVVQALRIGDVGIAAIPFETFVETGLDIKRRGPFPRTFTISLANGSYGYLPTPRHHELGGYETWLGTSRVEVQAAPKIVDTLMKLFEKLN